LRPSSVESRFEALHAAELTALVGREEELELLLRCGLARGPARFHRQGPGRSSVSPSRRNYISVYVSVTKAGAPLVPAYEGKLGELRMGGNNFSFVRFDDLRSPALSSLFAEADSIFRSDPENPVRYMQGM
jgi:hypothetical protein